MTVSDTRCTRKQLSTVTEVTIVISGFGRNDEKLETQTAIYRGSRLDRLRSVGSTAGVETDKRTDTTDCIAQPTSAVRTNDVRMRDGELFWREGGDARGTRYNYVALTNERTNERRLLRRGSSPAGYSTA